MWLLGFLSVFNYLLLWARVVRCLTCNCDVVWMALEYASVCDACELSVVHILDSAGSAEAHA